MSTDLDKSLHRMLTEFGDVYQFLPGMPPTHYNTLGLSKSVDWETGLLLKSYVEFCKPETVVELGTFRGYSTSWLIAGSYFTGRATWVHAYEVFNEGDYGWMWYDEFNLPKEWFTYHPIPGGIWKYPDQVPPVIDLIFHDTQHLLDPTISEMDFLLPRLSEHGTILVDDMLHPDYYPMQTYFHSLFEDPLLWDWSVLPLGHGLGIARKR